MTYGIFGSTPVDQTYRKAGILADWNLAAFTTNLARLPLMYEPGTRWHYSVSVDVQGRLIEVLSGKPFDRFLQENLIGVFMIQIMPNSEDYGSVFRVPAYQSIADCGNRPKLIGL